jgi:hypothetical protein
MQRKLLPAIVGSYVALAALGACQASAATLETQTPTVAFQAIYGNPPTGGPIGLGLGRNFGFGANLLFQADTKANIGSDITTEFGGSITFIASDAYIGGTLMSNKTGTNIPLGLTIQFADFDNVNQLVGEKKEPIQKYADTNDRPWITDICSPQAKSCELDPQFLTTARSIEIEDVSFDFGGNLVAQGTIWGKWVNGTAKTPPCMVFELPANNTEPTLVVTQTAGGIYPAVGTVLRKISGEACLIIANNYYYPGNTPQVIISP